MSNWAIFTQNSPTQTQMEEPKTTNYYSKLRAFFCLEKRKIIRSRDHWKEIFLFVFVFFLLKIVLINKNIVFLPMWFAWFVNFVVEISASYKDIFAQTLLTNRYLEWDFTSNTYTLLELRISADFIHRCIGGLSGPVRRYGSCLRFSLSKVFCFGKRRKVE